MGAKLLQPTMTGGELTPELHGRVDIARYMTALRRCRNFRVLPGGGVENREGTYFGGEREVGDHELIPFVYNIETAYVLFFGDGYIRFQSGGSDVLPTAPAYAGGTTYALDAYVTSVGIVYRSLQAANVGNTPASSPAWWVADPGLQITSPYAGADVTALRYTQSADVLYLTHGDYPTQVLRRLTANSFELLPFEAKDGPFIDLNANESIRVAASGVLGTVEIESSEDIFTAAAVGSLFYIEAKNLGKIKPWVVGDRDIVVGDLRRSDGKTYKAATVPSVGTWHEAGPRQPVHENGRAWDGGGEQRTNGSSTWSSGIEWEYVDSGFGVVKITSVTDARTAVGEVMKRLPAEVVGGVGAPANTWNLTGDGLTKSFAIAGAGFGVYAVTINGVGVTPDPNYNPGQPGEGGVTDDPYDPCPVVESYLLGMGELSAAEVVAGKHSLDLFDPELWQRDRGLVEYSATAMAPCYRIVTSRAGFEGDCSDSAPIWTKDRGYLKPLQLMGQEVLTGTDDPNEQPEWAVVVDIVSLGERAVQHIAVGQRNFWFGRFRGKFLLHHNRKPIPEP